MACTYSYCNECFFLDVGYYIVFYVQYLLEIIALMLIWL